MKQRKASKNFNLAPFSLSQFCLFIFISLKLSSAEKCFLFIFFSLCFRSIPSREVCISKIIFNMGHRNMLCSSQIIESEIEQQGQGYVYPGLSINFGGMTNFSPPIVRTMVTASGSSTSFETHYMSEHCDSSMLYGMSQCNGVQHQRSLELGVATPASSYYSYMTPSSSSGVLPVTLNRGASEHLLPSRSYGVGTPSCEYGRNHHFIDDVRGPCKRKSPEFVLGNCPDFSATACPSSSVAPLNMRHPEGVAAPDVASFSLPAQYIGSANPVMELGPQSGLTERPVASGMESFLTHDHNHIPQQNYMGQPFQPAGTLCLEPHSNNSSASGGVSSWNQAPVIPFMHGANIIVGSVEVASVGLPRYHETSNTTNSQSLWPPPPINHRQQNHHLSLRMQGFRSQNINFCPQATTASYRIPSNLSHNNVNFSQNGLETGGHRQPGTVPSTGSRIYCPQRGATPENSLRHQILPQMRILQADEVAMLEIPDFYEVGSFVDHHREMRMDIEDMSYEELLALGERIGHVNTGLSEGTIMSKLKTKTYLSSATLTNIEQAGSSDKQTNVCIICQDNYKCLEKIGTLDCGHEYHVECLKKWLLLKNVCPICKSEALATAKEDV